MQVVNLPNCRLTAKRAQVPLDHGRGQLDLLAVPWAAVPGNHDITAPVLSLTFGSGPAPEPRFHEPDGVRHLIQNEDIPDPYQGR